MDPGYARHLRIRHSDDRCAEGRNHINGIESFWSFAKRRLAKFNALSKHTFQLHLKECEFRFNHRHRDLYRGTLTLPRSDPSKAGLLPKTLGNRSGLTFLRRVRVWPDGPYATAIRAGNAAARRPGAGGR